MNIRQQIVNKALNRLREIQIDNGSATNVGRYAFWWRRQPLRDDQLPAVVGFDMDCPISGEGASVGFKAHALTLEIEICAQEDQGDELVRAAMDDVAKMELRVVGEPYWLDGLPVNTNASCTVVNASMDVQEAENKSAAARVTMVVNYQAPRGGI